MARPDNSRRRVGALTNGDEVDIDDKLKKYDPVTGDDEDDEDGFDEDGFDTDDIEAYEAQREGLRHMLGADHSTGRLWHEICFTLQSLTVAMQAAERGCLVRTISWIRSHNDGDDVQWIFHDTSTWLPGVTLEHLKAEPKASEPQATEP